MLKPKHRKQHSEREDHYASWKRIFGHALASTLVLVAMIWLLGKLPHINAGFFGPIENAIEDINFSDIYLQNNNTPEYLNTVDNILMVNLNDSRADIANLVDTIMAYQPKVVAMDVIFNARPDSANEKLMKSICSHRDKIVLACKVYGGEEKPKTTTEPNDSVSFFMNNPACKDLSLGYVNVEGESKSRTIRYFVASKQETGGGQIHSFAVEVARKAGFDINLQDIPICNANRETFINYRPNANERFQTINQERLLADNIIKASLKDKIIILGHSLPSQPESSRDLDDLHYTPLNKDFVGRSNPDMYGPQIQGYIIAMLLTHDYIKSISTVWLHILAFFVSLFVMVLVIRIGHYHHGLLHAGAFGIRILLGIMALYLAYLLFKYANWNIEVAYMLSYLVLCIEALALWEAIFHLFLSIKKRI